MELAARQHEVHFFSYAKPVRLDLSASRIHFHQVDVAEHPVFPCPDYTLPLAVMMANGEGGVKDMAAAYVYMRLAQHLGAQFDRPLAHRIGERRHDVA